MWQYIFPSYDRFSHAGTTLFSKDRLETENRFLRSLLNLPETENRFRLYNDGN